MVLVLSCLRRRRNVWRGEEGGIARKVSYSNRTTTTTAEMAHVLAHRVLLRVLLPTRNVMTGSSSRGGNNDGMAWGKTGGKQRHLMLCSGVGWQWRTKERESQPWATSHGKRTPSPLSSHIINHYGCTRLRHATSVARRQGTHTTKRKSL